MNKVNALLLGLLTCGFMSTSLFADGAEGQKFYLKELNICKKDGLSDGGKFTTKLDRDTWENLKEDGKLVTKWKEICPSASAKFDTLSVSEQDNLYDFCWQFASDGDVPSCG